MKSYVEIFCLTLTMLTLAACQNIKNDPYITSCEGAIKRSVKVFYGAVDGADKARANGLCACRSRGLQSVLSADEYNGLTRATKAGKARKFRIIEQKYLTDLISTNPNVGTGIGKVRSVCSKYGVEVKNNFSRKKEIPPLPY